MPLKKKQFSEEEIAIFDEVVIYKRGDQWHFRMWLNGEGKYARKSLRPAVSQRRPFRGEIIGAY